MDAIRLDGHVFLRASVLRDGPQREEFGRLFFEQYRRRMLCYARQCLPTPEDAEDVFSSAVYSIMRYLGDCREHFEGWAYKVLRNEIRRFYRVRREQLSFEQCPPPVIDPRPLEALAQAESTRRLRQLTRQLKGQERVPFVLRAYAGLSDREIAQGLGMSYSAVKCKIFRAKRDLGVLARSDPVLRELRA